MPLILIGLSSWAWTGIATAVTALGGYGLVKGANVLQARRLARAFEGGGHAALRKQVFEEGLATCSEHADYIVAEFLSALAPAAIAAAPTSVTTVKAS